MPASGRRSASSAAKPPAAHPWGLRPQTPGGCVVPTVVEAQRLVVGGRVAGDARAAERVEPVLDGAGLRVAVVCARFNDLITRRLLEGAQCGLGDLGVAEADVTVAWVPGAFEIPIAAQAFAGSGRVDAVICLGAVIRGETSHYDFVAGQCAEGIQHAALDTGVPVAFGVLTTEDLDQALARSEPPGGHNVGEECAATAVEMARLLQRVNPR